MQEVLSDEQKLTAEAYKARRCVFELKGKAINPYHVIERVEYEECNASDLSKSNNAGKGQFYSSDRKGKKVQVMFVDQEIELDSHFPEELKNDFAELQEYYNADDWFQFDLLFDLVECRAKAYFHAGKISREDLNQIFRKYGAA